MRRRRWCDFRLWAAGETGGLSSPLMAAEDRLFRGGGTATILCVMIQPPLESRAHAHNIIDTDAAAAAAATAAVTTAATTVTSRSQSPPCVYRVVCRQRLPPLDLLFDHN